MLTIDAQSNSRIFDLTIPDASTATISGLTLAHGSAPSGNGGAIVNRTASHGSLVINDSALIANTAYLNGGGIWTNGDAVISGTVFEGNIAGYGSNYPYAGGGAELRGNVEIVDSTFIDNSSAYGGALKTKGSDVSITITGSTFAGNTATLHGGAFDLGSVTSGLREAILIANSTFTDNTAPAAGAIFIHNDQASVEILQTTITGNTATLEARYPYSNAGGIVLQQPYYDGQTAPPLTLSGTILAGNASVVGSTDLSIGRENPGSATVTAEGSFLGIMGPGVTIQGAGNASGTDPMLGALADNGGPTLTMLPLPGSPVIDAGPDPVATFPGNEFDQRGSGFARVTNGRVEIGAVELQLPIVTSIAPPSGPAAGGTLITLSGAHFAVGMTVTIAGLSCTEVTVLSPGSATCVTPGGDLGPADVVVTTEVGPVALVGAFTYTASGDPVVPEFTG